MNRIRRKELIEHNEQYTKQKKRNQILNIDWSLLCIEFIEKTTKKKIEENNNKSSFSPRIKTSTTKLGALKNVNGAYLNRYHSIHFLHYFPSFLSLPRSDSHSKMTTRSFLLLATKKNVFFFFVFIQFVSFLDFPLHFLSNVVCGCCILHLA